MSLLAELKAEVADYAKSMPKHGVAKDLDFEMWGKGFCEKMVSFQIQTGFHGTKTYRLG